MAWLVLGFGILLLVLGIVFRVQTFTRPDLEERYVNPESYIHALASVQIATGAVLCVAGVLGLLIPSFSGWPCGLAMLVAVLVDFILIVRRQFRDRRDDPHDSTRGGRTS